MWFDKLTTNGINKLPFVLSLSKDLIGVSLTGFTWCGSGQSTIE